MESRKYEKIMDLVDNRVQYMYDVGGFSQTKVNSISDIVKEVGYVSEEIAEFTNLVDDDGEFRRLLIEAAASIILMATKLDENKFESPDIKTFVNGGPVFGPGSNREFTPNHDYSIHNYGIENILSDLRKSSRRSL